PYPLPRPPSYSEEVRAALHRAADGARLRGQLSAADHAFPAQHQASPTWTPDQSRSSELIRGGPAPGSEAPPWFSSQRSMAANILSSFFRAIALASASTMSPVLRSLRVFSARPPGRTPAPGPRALSCLFGSGCGYEVHHPADK